MDEHVRLAMAKWPQVPACYGWLGLDARGEWRMRDQRCQELGLLGDKINNHHLRDFINRNYLADKTGQYYFQNGPQQVFVRLESAPYTVRSVIHTEEPQHHWQLHTGIPMPLPDHIWFTVEGQFFMQCGHILAQLDDRDIPDAIKQLRWQEQIPSDQQLLDWLDTPQPGLVFLFAQHPIPVHLSSLTELARIIPFIANPIPTGTVKL